MSGMYDPPHPGSILAETLEHLGLNARQFAKPLDVTPAAVTRVMKCESPVTPELAVRIAHVLPGPSAAMWLRPLPRRLAGRAHARHLPSASPDAFRGGEGRSRAHPPGGRRGLCRLNESLPKGRAVEKSRAPEEGGTRRLPCRLQVSFRAYEGRIPAENIPFRGARRPREGAPHRRLRHSRAIGRRHETRGGCSKCAGCARGPQKG